MVYQNNIDQTINLHRNQWYKYRGVRVRYLGMEYGELRIRYRDGREELISKKDIQLPTTK